MTALISSQHFSHFKNMWIFSDAQGQLTPHRVQGQIWLKFKLIQVFMIVQVICKNETDPTKMKALER